jgi:hypothetical protein
MAAAAAQGPAPTPMSGIGATSAAMNAPPAPSLDIASNAAAAAQSSAPTPMAGIWGMSAVANAPPVPSLDIASAGASGMTEDMPRPEGEPAVVAKKKPAGKS